MNHITAPAQFTLKLQHSGEDTTYLTLGLAGESTPLLSFSIQDARELACRLIQHAHQADVRHSLKRSMLG